MIDDPCPTRPYDGELLPLCLMQCEGCGRWNVEVICGQEPAHPMCAGCHRQAEIDTADRLDHLMHRHLGARRRA